MSISVADIRSRVSQHFVDVEQIDDSVLRCTKRSLGRPYAIYYFDVASPLPTTPEALRDYQDRIIGKRYFDGDKSLQWSNYLYFLVSDEQLANETTQRAKSLIEGDRTYARKCVITADDLSTSIQPPTLPAPHDTAEPNVYAVWLEKLSKAGLEDAILSDDNLPTRLSLIETSKANPDAAPYVVPTRAAATPLPFIRSLSLERFRPFPTVRSFEFGDVNLVVGVNGSGKTSLLEAIELLYCGRTKRNPQSGESYRIDAVYANGESEIANNRRALQTFRDRNLQWYGHAEVRSHNLCYSFGRFNFLDTDAAVQMSETASEVQESLAKLLVGADASKVWNDMERVQREVASRVRELEPQQALLTAELASITAQLSQPADALLESDSIFSQLKEMAAKCGWTLDHEDRDQFAAALVSSLTELVSVVQQATALDWARSPVTVAGLQSETNALLTRCNSSDAEILRLSELLSEENKLSRQQTRLRTIEQLLQTAERLMASSIPQLAAERERLSALAQTSRFALSGRPASNLAALFSSSGKLSVEESIQSVAMQKHERTQALQGSRQAYEAFAAQRELATNLAQQLREIAAQIIQAGSKPEECPLCHTNFPPGELEQHIGLGLDRDLELHGQQLLLRLRTDETGLQEASAAENATNWLGQFCNRKGLSLSTTVADVLAEVEASEVALTNAEHRLQLINQELLALESQGLFLSALQDIPQLLQEQGYPLTELTKQEIAVLSEQLRDQLTKSIEESQSIRAKVNLLQTTLARNLELADPDINQLRAASSRIYERAATAQAISQQLARWRTSFPWDETKPLAELAILAESVRKVAADYQATVTRERQATSLLREATARKEKIELQLKELGPKLSRFVEADATLRDICDNYSLTGAMKSALARNRTGIEAVFSRIHCPAEFCNLADDLKTLVRKKGNVAATISEISTGQRAALALAIFLAQNAQLSTAPPVILIDDPIAHVDDLNSLSFLDYLRELALTGKRQIFFATASDKLAALFERKFDFLGSDRFRRYDFHRTL